MTSSPRGDVLVIDRDAAAREQLQRQLLAAGFDVVLLDRASDAVERFVAHQAALILVAMDAEPPSSLVALARIRELPGGREVPIQALTRASGAELARVRSFGAALGITEFLGHPPESLDLQRQLAALAAAPGPEPAAPAAEPKQTLRTLREAHLRVARQTHFERLGLSPSDGSSAVRAAYRRAVHAFRPEIVVEQGEEVRRLVREIFESLGQSYRLLSDPTKREDYRATLPLEAEAEPEAARQAPVESANPEVEPELETWSPEPAAPPEPEIHIPEPAAAEPAAARRAPAFSWPAVDDEPPEEAPLSDAIEAPEEVDLSDDDPSPPPAADALLESADELAAAARLLTILGEHEGAAELFGHAASLEPGDPELRYELALNLGRKHRKRGDLARARTHFQEATRLAPDGEPQAAIELAALDSTGAAPARATLRSLVLRTNSRRL